MCKQRVDSNILDNEILSLIIPPGVDVEVETLNKALILALAAAIANGAVTKLSSMQSASIDSELHIRHGAMQQLRNLKSLVTHQRETGLPLGQPIFEALRLNTRELLVVAADQLCSSVDFNCLIESTTDAGDGHMSRVMEGSFHADGREGLEEEQDSKCECCNIGNETTDKWEK